MPVNSILQFNIQFNRKIQLNRKILKSRGGRMFVKDSYGNSVKVLGGLKELIKRQKRTH